MQTNNLPFPTANSNIKPNLLFLSRLSIAEYVWGDNFDLFNMTNFVDVHIKNIRKKLDEFTDNKIIKTVRGIGFMIEGR